MTSIRTHLVFRLLLCLSLFNRFMVNGMFSVNDDLLAYPQFQVKILDDTTITHEEAIKRLSSRSRHDERIISDAMASTIGGGGGSGAEKVDVDDTAPFSLQSQQDRLNGDSGAKGTGGGLGAMMGSGGDEYEEVDLTWEAMWLNKKRYLCSIPILKPPPKLNATELQKTKEDEEKEMSRAAVKGLELIKGMEGQCIYFISGWWSYSFCHNNIIKQFHQLPPANGLPLLPPKEDPHSASYVLGKSEPGDAQKEGNTEMQVNGEVKYLVQRISGGTHCEITGKERRIEVQFHCNPKISSDRIAFIKEVTTCAYLMVINTPRLCADKVFLPPVEGHAHSIQCREIVSEAQKQQQKQEQRRRRESKKLELESRAAGTKKEQIILSTDYDWQEDILIKYLAEIGLHITENEAGYFEVSQKPKSSKEFREALQELYTAPGNLVVKTLKGKDGKLKPLIVTIDEEGVDHDLEMPTRKERKKERSVHDEL